MDIRQFVSSEGEDEIKTAIRKIGSTERLKPIKDLLPDEISYEQIRFIVAHIECASSARTPPN